MERKALLLFKEFSLEFACVPELNRNTVRQWFKARKYHILHSRTTWYEFVDILDWTKTGEDTLSLNAGELKETFKYDPAYIQKLEKLIATENKRVNKKT